MAPAESRAEARQLHLSGEFEEIHYFADAKSGLRAIVVIHDASLGPALGGIRCARYDSEEAALAEVCRLARTMTLKCLLAELPAGGGKALLFDRPGLDRHAAFRALGERLERLGGRFFTAGDLGTGPADLEAVGATTRFVAIARHGVDQDLAARTAEGVWLAASTALELIGIDAWKGQRIAVQGLGAIGAKLAMLALRAGARVIAADVNAERAGRAADAMPITLVDPDALVDSDCEVFAPCAGSGALDSRTIERLRCRIVCGAANDQLARADGGARLAARGILHVPDLLANAGAVILGCGAALPDFEPPRDLSGIGRRVREVLAESLATQRPPQAIALERAERRLREVRAGLSP